MYIYVYAHVIDTLGLGSVSPIPLGACARCDEFRAGGLKSGKINGHQLAYALNTHTGAASGRCAI